MPENTKQKLNSDEELQSAKILFQEGLLEEARKKLYQILMIAPNFRRAEGLLKEIQDHEMKGLLSQSIPRGRNQKINVEDPEKIIRKLSDDLGLGLSVRDFNPDQENWVHQEELGYREHYDLGVAFFEMGCYRDAIRELKTSEKKIRIEQTFLGERGVAVVALYCESLVHLGSAFEAKAYLEPVLTEADLKLEEKHVLFYVMALIEEALGHPAETKGWLLKVAAFNPDFREVRFKLKQLP